MQRLDKRHDRMAKLGIFHWHTLHSLLFDIIRPLYAEALQEATGYTHRIQLWSVNREKLITAVMKFAKATSQLQGGKCKWRKHPEFRGLLKELMLGIPALRKAEEPWKRQFARWLTSEAKALRLK